MAQYVVATGNIRVGIEQIVGPFLTWEEANSWAERHDDSLSEAVCQPFVMDVQSPTEYLEEER